MTDLKKSIKRITFGQIHEAGRARKIVVILRPPNVLGFRAKGCRKEYQLTAEACYLLAVRAEQRDKQKRKRGQQCSRKNIDRSR